MFVLFNLTDVNQLNGGLESLRTHDKPVYDIHVPAKASLINNQLRNLSQFNETIGFEPRYDWAHIYITGVILGVLILATIIGNVFVVAAIILEKNLQSVSNYLILSLAVADLMVATLVMPISALKEVSKHWWLGMELCDVWVCFDVLCCTASILHLIAIAMDRYWAVTSVDYIHNRTARRIIYMIVGVWVSSVVISIPARFHVHRSTVEWQNVMVFGQCLINDGYIYTIFSTVGAFYLPMVFMICIYIRIYQTARNRIRKRTFTKKCKTSSSHHYHNSSSFTKNNSFENSKHNHNNNNNSFNKRDSSKKLSKKPLDKHCEDPCRESKYPNPSRNKIATETITAQPSTTLDSFSITGCHLSGMVNGEGLINQFYFDNLGNIPFVDDSCEDDDSVFEDDFEEEERELGTSTAMTPLYNLTSSVRDYFSETSETAPTSLDTSLPTQPPTAVVQPLPKQEHKSNYTDSSDRTDEIPLYARDSILIKKKKKSTEALVSSSFAMTAGAMSCDENGEDQTLRRRAQRMESMREKLEQKRERKAARTLAIITGCFLLCWLPFFISALVVPFCFSECPLPEPVNSFFLWLGYLNSLLNPIIYTIFSPEFRNAFRKILFGRYHTQKRR